MTTTTAPAVLHIRLYPRHLTVAVIGPCQAARRQLIDRFYRDNFFFLRHRHYARGCGYWRMSWYAQTWVKRWLEQARDVAYLWEECC